MQPEPTDNSAASGLRLTVLHVAVLVCAASVLIGSSRYVVDPDFLDHDSYMEFKVDSAVVSLLAVIAVTLVLGHAYSRRRGAALMLAAIGLLGAGLSGIDLTRMSSGFYPTPGWGLYLALVASLGLVVGAGMLAYQLSASPATSPVRWEAPPPVAEADEVSRRPSVARLLAAFSLVSALIVIAGLFGLIPASGYGGGPLDFLLRLVRPVLSFGFIAGVVALVLGMRRPRSDQRQSRIVRLSSIAVGLWFLIAGLVLFFLWTFVRYWHF